MTKSTKFLLAFLAVIGLYFTARCGVETSRTVDPTEVRAERLRIEANVAGRLKYVRDPRTGICFAYMWEGCHNQGGPALATVPCDKVEHLMK